MAMELHEVFQEVRRAARCAAPPEERVVTLRGVLAEAMYEHCLRAMPTLQGPALTRCVVRYLDMPDELLAVSGPDRFLQRFAAYVALELRPE